MPNELIDKILDSDVLMPLIMGTIAVVWVVFGTISGTIRSVARERTKREIAAYIAEGSMTPEHGERLIRAGRKEDAC